MLSLAEIEEGHHSCLLVLRWVPLEDLGDELLVDGIEFERNLRIVIGCITVLASIS